MDIFLTACDGIESRLTGRMILCDSDNIYRLKSVVLHCRRERFYSVKTSSPKVIRFEQALSCIRILFIRKVNLKILTN